jgi:hypothetical protein
MVTAYLFGGAPIFSGVVVLEELAFHEQWYQFLGGFGL